MSNKPITTMNTFRAYLLSKGIRLEDYKFKEEDNIYGIQDVEPIRNPYLWNRLISDRHYQAVDFLLYHYTQIFSSNIAIALLQSRLDNGLDNNRINRILDLVFEDKDNTEFNADSMLMDLISVAKYKILSKVINYLKLHDINPTEQGVFFKSAISESCKLEDRRILDLLLSEYPQLYDTSDVIWGYLNALKRAKYSLAKFLVLKFKVDIRAKNDLGYKLIKRNYDNKLVIQSKDEEESYHFLLNLYSIEHKSDS